MGFEDFSLILKPDSSTDTSGQFVITSIDSVVENIVSKWPQVHSDELGKQFMHLTNPRDELLCYEDEDGIFQILIYAYSVNVQFRCEMRIAYCNPSKTDSIYCDLAEWLIKEYNLVGQLLRPMSPVLACEKDISLTDDTVHDIVIPSIQYNRKFWQLDVQSTEERKLRPEEALYHYIVLKMVMPSTNMP